MSIYRHIAKNLFHKVEENSLICPCISNFFVPKFFSYLVFDKVPNTSVLFLECLAQFSRGSEIVRPHLLAPFNSCHRIEFD